MNRVVCAVSTVLAIVTSAFSQRPTQDSLNHKYRYIGQSNCSPQFDSAINRYGVRLDRNQRAYLTTYQFKDSEIIAIVQYEEDRIDARKTCGVVRDVAQVEDKNSSVIWDCVDRRISGDVVIGTWPSKHPALSGPAVEAWRIDLEKLEFIEIERPQRFVHCRPESRAGNDDGLGLSDVAKKRIVKLPR